MKVKSATAFAPAMELQISCVQILLLLKVHKQLIGQ